MGCRNDVAVEIIYTSNKLGINPELFSMLIYSESSFNTNINHGLHYVKGLCGVNTLAHPALKPLAETWKGNLMAGAIEFKNCLNKHPDSIIDALTMYKGASKLGRRQAKFTFELYRKFVFNEKID